MFHSRVQPRPPRGTGSLVRPVIATSICSLVLSASALAADVSVPATAFEIDGNTAVDANTTPAGDWNSTSAQYPALRHASHTDDACNDATTPGDLCGIWRAYELIVNASGNYEMVLYGAWSRALVTGAVEVDFPFYGLDAASVADDVIIRYAFLDSTQTTEVTILKHDGTDWSPVLVPAGSITAATTEGVETKGSQPVGFGEFAINLSSISLLPPEGPCTTLISESVSARAAGDQSPLDSVELAPLTITNCGTVSITKAVTGTADPDTEFVYSVYRVNGGVIRSPDTTLLDDLLAPNETDEISALLIGPDYVVAEEPLSGLWSQVSLDCTALDPATGVSGPYDLLPGADGSMPLAPGSTASCTLVNASTTIDTDGPSVNSLAIEPNPVPDGGSVVVTASVSDSSTGGSAIASAALVIDGGDPVDLDPVDGAFDEPQESVGGSIVIMADPLPAMVNVCVRATDSIGNVGTASCSAVSVFDPSTAGVNGTGWLDSPAGAVIGDSSATGRADFRFNSNYLKGGSNPDGVFVFSMPDGRQVMSTDLTQLKVSKGGTAIQLDGIATIDGSEGKRFTVWATDGASRSVADTIRIRIWDHARVIYDSASPLPVRDGGIVVNVGR